MSCSFPKTFSKVVVSQQRPGKWDERRGLTLLEIMITVAVLGLALMMALGFFTESVKATFVSEQKNLINQDIRKLTSELSRTGRQANYVVLYNSFRTQDRNNSSDRKLNGNSGDFLVFIFQDVPDIGNPIYAPRAIRRIVGYYRSPDDLSDPESMGPVRKFDINIPAPSNPSNPPQLESLLPAESAMNSHDVVLALSQGLADNRLFYNLGNGTIMVNGKIVHGVEAKRVTDTYNFTLSTRR